LTQGLKTNLIDNITSLFCALAEKVYNQVSAHADNEYHTAFGCTKFECQLTVVSFDVGLTRGIGASYGQTRTQGQH